MTITAYIVTLAGIVTVITSVFHAVRIGYRIASTLAATVDGLTELTEVVAAHLYSHTTEGPYASKRQVDGISTQVADLTVRLDAVSADLRTWLGKRVGTVPAQATPKKSSTKSIDSPP